MFQLGDYIFRILLSALRGSVYFKTSLYRPGYIMVRQCLFDSDQILLLFTQQPFPKLGQWATSDKTPAWSGWQVRTAMARARRPESVGLIPYESLSCALWVISPLQWWMWRMNWFFLISVTVWASTQTHTLLTPQAPFGRFTRNYWSNCKRVHCDDMLWEGSSYVTVFISQNIY